MRVTSHTHLAIATIILSFAFTCYGASVSEPNKPSAEKASPREVSSHAQNDSDAIRAAKAELQAEMYKDSADSLKWALGIIIGLVIIFIGYATFKSTREYRQTLADVKGALNQAREASKEARDASDRTRVWEEKAQERLRSIDKDVANKLKEIERRGKALITELIKEAEKQREVSREQAEKQRKISELFAKAMNADQNKNYTLAAEYYEQILRIEPTNVPALNNCGVALSYLAERKEGDEADKLFAQTCEKYAKAVQIKPDEEESYCNWGNALSDWAKIKEGDQADKLFAQACEKYAKAVQIKPDDEEYYCNWGAALSDWAERKEGDEADKLFAQACEKYAKAIQIKSDMYEVYNNWSHTLLDWSKKKTGKERKQMLGQAKEKCLKTESIKPGEGAYNLACVHALLGEEKECQKWLKTGEKAGTLVTREHAMADADLKSVRDKGWFKQIRWSDAPK